jgi:hypothetical protein
MTAMRRDQSSLSEIARALVRECVITHDAAVEAEQRKKLYGGGLDTALLELRATDEETLTSALAEIIGIPLLPLAAITAGNASGADWISQPKPIAEGQGNPSRVPITIDRSSRVWMDMATAQKIGAAPRSRHGDVLDVLVRPEHDHDAMVAWAEQRSLLIEPVLICEVRFRAHLSTLYDIPMPPRYLSLLAKLVGTANARMVAERAREDMRTPTPVTVGVDPIETLLAAARLGDPTARRRALRRLSRRLDDHRVLAFRHALERKAIHGGPVIAAGALRALAELRDKSAVPVIIDLLDNKNEDIVAAAQASLIALTCEDLGRKSKRWLDWWEKMGGLSRVEWLLEGLAHRTPELRLLASNELYEISGEYFGYHYDLPERDREEARLRWVAWWQNKTIPP